LNPLKLINHQILFITLFGIKDSKFTSDLMQRRLVMVIVWLLIVLGFVVAVSSFVKGYSLGSKKKEEEWKLIAAEWENWQNERAQMLEAKANDGKEFEVVYLDNRRKYYQIKRGQDAADIIMVIPEREAMERLVVPRVNS
jgi:hypothetical protein